MKKIEELQKQVEDSQRFYDEKLSKFITHSLSGFGL